jgi:putative serine protease PepD
LFFGLASSGVINFNLPQSANISNLGKITSTDNSSNVEGSSATNPDWDAVNKKIAQSVVSIQLTSGQSEVLGSGVIIDAQGYVVTNNHVASALDGKSDVKLEVILQNGNIYEGSVKGTDPTTDLAVVQIKNPPSDLVKADFGDSDSLSVGQPVMAVGNPLGYANTATTGVISALNRPVSASDESGSSSNISVTNAIQIDAAINSGNSGGPLFDGNGHIIGITSSIATTSTSTGSIGIGFALPSNVVDNVSKQLIDNGKAKHAYLGANLTDATATADGVTRNGAKISNIKSDSPAGKAGLKDDDIIVAIDDHSVTNSYALMGFVREYNPDATAKITFVRDSKSQSVEVKLGTAPEETPTPTPTPTQSPDNNGDGGGGFFDPFDFLFNR